jgi:hypothetical protein
VWLSLPSLAADLGGARHAATQAAQQLNVECVTALMLHGTAVDAAAGNT